jgi:NAD(P)-dependent dehydrogenase (short-subunit alcohol dehydrogenase family)
MASEPLAIVTGAGHRIGKAFALTLARNGYAILLHYWASEADATDAARELRAVGAQVHLCRADLTELQGLEVLFAEADKTARPLKYW